MGRFLAGEKRNNWIPQLLLVPHTRRKKEFSLALGNKLLAAARLAL
jgi:hypothetical protein